MNNRGFTRLRPSGFTLIEIMVVIVIIGIIASIVIVRLTGHVTGSEVAITKASMKMLRGQCELFRLNHHRYPERLDDLMARPSFVEEKDWPVGGYLEEQPRDAWKQEFVYRPGGGTYELVSLGQDGHEGGEGAAADLTIAPTAAPPGR